MKNLTFKSYLKRRRISLHKLLARFSSFESLCSSLKKKGVQPPIDKEVIEGLLMSQLKGDAITLLNSGAPHEDTVIVKPPTKVDKKVVVLPKEVKPPERLVKDTIETTSKPKPKRKSKPKPKTPRGSKKGVKTTKKKEKS